MDISREERNQILHMVAAGKVSAEEAGLLLDALHNETAEASPAPEFKRTLRIWVTDMNTRNRKLNLTATLPVGILRTGLRALGDLIPQLRDGRADNVLQALEQGSTGRVMDLQNLEDGKRIEIFIEQ